MLNGSNLIARSPSNEYRRVNNQSSEPKKKHSNEASENRNRKFNYQINCKNYSKNIIGETSMIENIARPLYTRKIPNHKISLDDDLQNKSNTNSNIVHNKVVSIVNDQEEEEKYADQSPLTKKKKKSVKRKILCEKSLISSLCSSMTPRSKIATSNPPKGGQGSCDELKLNLYETSKSHSQPSYRSKMRFKNEVVMDGTLAQSRIPSCSRNGNSTGLIAEKANNDVYTP